jgi:dipeptidyl aminopeptidase/acylaminoacyl peptidase
MSVTSDISDWTFGQLGLDYDQIKGTIPNSGDLKLFYDRSPSSYYQTVECRTLIMLGEMDLRVHPSQGKYWAQLLKGRLGEENCMLYTFPDANHGLETAESERFGLQIIVDFLKL